ncbi:MAG: dual specificity protein phosphatase family protein [Verrucomicrobia bacterium]|nr:dual specificity protein phosphatase family protein [Verrucomicrobiota bacterium]
MTTAITEEDFSTPTFEPVSRVHQYLYDRYVKHRIELPDVYGDRKVNYDEWKGRIKASIENTLPVSEFKISFHRKSSFAPLQIFYNFLHKLCRQINYIWNARHIHVQEIIPGVYLGDLRAFEQIDKDGWIKYKGIPIAKIDRVVTCLRNKNITNPHIQQITIPVADRKDRFQELVAHASSPSPQTFWDNDPTHESWFAHSYTFIQDALNADQKVLIHCRGGVSRSPTVLIAYLMKEFGVTHDQALNYVRSRRRGVDPNIGFRAGLQEYNNRLKSIPTS